MSLIFLLDTNVISEPLRPAPNSHVLAQLKQYEAEIAIPAVVWHELFFGCYRLPRSAKRTAIKTYLNEVIAPTLPILPYDAQAAEWHSLERARLVSLGKTPPFADGQIAAIAGVNGLTLVTANVSDFSAFQGIEIVNWHLPAANHPS